MTPIFTHDCDRCQLIGIVRLNQRYEVYRCARQPDVLGDTLVARYGHEGSEYASMDAGVIAGSVLAPGDDAPLTPAIRAILIALLIGSFPVGGA